MNTVHQRFPVHVLTGWVDYSPAFHWETSQTLRSAVAGFESRIRSIVARIAEDEPHNPASRRGDVEVVMKPLGSFTVSSTGVDLDDLLDRMADAVRTRLKQAVHVNGSETLSRIA